VSLGRLRKFAVSKLQNATEFVLTNIRNPATRPTGIQTRFAMRKVAVDAGKRGNAVSWRTDDAITSTGPARWESRQKTPTCKLFSHVTGKKTASAGKENRVTKTTDNARRKMEFASISRQAEATGSKADIVTGSLIVSAGSKKKKIVMEIVPSEVTNALGRFFQNIGSVRIRNAAMTAALVGDSVNQHNGVQAKKEDVGQNPQGVPTKPLAFATSKVAIAGDNVNKTQPVLVDKENVWPDIQVSHTK